MWRMIGFCFALRRHKLRRANTISFRLRKETVFGFQRKATRGSVLWTPRTCGSLREKPWSPLKQWGVVWEYRIPLVRCTVLLTNFVPRNQPAARRLRPRQRRERKRSLPRTAARPNYSFSDRTSETHDIRERYARKKTMISASGSPFLSYTGRGAFFLFGQEPKRKNGGRNEAGNDF